MARVTYGAEITAITGSIGGTTFQNNSSGAIARLRPTPRRKSTIKQTQAHATHIGKLQEWQALTSTQKDSWTAFAAAHTKINKYGQSKKLTGQNWFEALNINLEQIGGTPLVVPPTYTLPGEPPAITIDISDDDFNINIADTLDWSENAILIWATQPRRPNNLSGNVLRKFIQAQASDPSGVITITAEWVNAIGLAWTPSTTFPNTNILVCIQTVQKVSGISSAFLCTLAPVPESGWLLTPDGAPLEDTAGNQLSQP